MPISLSDWADRLESQPLPAMALTVQHVTLLIDRPSTRNADYQRVGCKDPGFALAVFRSFQKVANSPSEPAANLAHAIALLGISPLIKGMKNLPVLKKSTGTANPGLLHCYSRAAHAAWYAYHWGLARRDSNPEEMAVAALLHDCGEMSLWAHAREEMEQIDRRCAQGIKPAEAATALLGFDLGQLSRELAQRWRLPPLVAGSAVSSGAFESRSLGVMLAAALARASAVDWRSGETAEFIELAAEYQRQTVDRTTAHTHTLAADAARALYGLLLPATATALLHQTPDGLKAPMAETIMPPSPPPTEPVAKNGGTLSPPDDDSWDGKERASGGIQVDQAATGGIQRVVPGGKPVPGLDEYGDQGACFYDPLSPTSPEGEMGLLKHPVSQDHAARRQPPTPPQADKQAGLRRLPTYPPRPQDTLGRIMREMEHDVGMDRTLFALLTPDRKALRPKFVLGADQASPLRAFQPKLDKPHLFSLLMKKPQGFWLRPENRQKFLPMIPPSLLDSLNTEGFFTISLFVRGQPIGMLYGDCNHASQLNAQRFDQFKRLARQLSDELGQGR